MIELRQPHPLLPFAIFRQRTLRGADIVGLLIGTVVIVGGLTFLPALALGPVAEQFAMQAGTTY